MSNSSGATATERFVAHVGSDGNVRINHGAETLFLQPKPLASLLRWLNNADEIRSDPKPPLEGDDGFLWMLCDDPTEANEVWASYDKVYNVGRYNDSDLKVLGQFLFGKLIGDVAWKSIMDRAGASAPGTTIELALQFDADLQELHRFNWELMWGDGAFLAHERVAITRLVERRETKGPDPFLRPPKVLFVIGTSHTDKRVRPGAEYFALMRQLENEGHTIHSRVLQLASPLEIRGAVESFRPDLVHFISHGDVGDDGHGQTRGYLELRTENKKKPYHRFASGLLTDLKVGDTYPSIVLLSACQSGALPSAGAARTGSLAAELVAGGVPIVVGMSGSVSDVACRLFSRRLGGAVLAGESLVAATAEGRWAAFVDRTPETIDWALPTLFMGADVKPGFVPVELKEEDEDPGAILSDRMDTYGIPRYPVFCARYRFFEQFYRLFSNAKSARRVLVIWTADNTPGIGRTRLLQELAAQALREGQVPILVASNKTEWEPRNLAQLAVEFLRAVAKAREAFDLPPRVDNCTLLNLVLDEEPYENYASDKGKYTPKIRLDKILAHLSQAGDVLDADVARGAMHEEIQALLEELRQPPVQITKESRAVVLLDQVHEYGDAIVPLLRVLIDNFGLGTKKEGPVPVVLCHSKRTPADDRLREATENNSIRWWQEELKPFQEDDEDMLAYQQVWLHPDRDLEQAQELWAEVLENSEDVEGEEPGFAINTRADPKVAEKWIKKFRKRIKGVPVLLSSESMFLTMEDSLGDAPYTTKAGKNSFLIPADDETKLRKLRE